MSLKSVNTSTVLGGLKSLDSAAIFRQVLETTTSSGAEALTKLLATKYVIGWKPVGGRENNHATIDLGKDPAAGLVERITNAIDAVLQREWIERGKPPGLRSPREAVEQWFGIKGGRLQNIADVRDPRIVELAKRVCVSLHDSGQKDRPTVDVRDYGCGIRSEDFAKTILSLNESNKVGHFFLMGAYGQGGSTSLAYPEYTLILSRALRLEGEKQSPPVAFTLVRFNPRDPATEKHGVYEYLVDMRTGCPLTLDVPEQEFPTGTLVRMVAMELPRYAGIMTAPTHSLWYLVHHYLFDPVLPFRIEERRSNKSQGQNRHIYGNVRRLNSEEETEYRCSAVVDFRKGKVTITWWVLPATGDNPQGKIANYTAPSRPIVITFNGQKQGDLSNNLIKNELKLPYLDKYLVVHVDCDQLDHESRRKLFATTRESLRETPLRDELEQLVVDTLAEDDRLRELNEARKALYIRREESEAMNALRKRLASRVRSYIATGAGGAGPRRPDKPRPLPPRSLEPIPIVDPPTFLEITSRNPLLVYPGRRFGVRFRTDADPKYFGDGGCFEVLVSPRNMAKFLGLSAVQDGYGVAYFAVEETAGAGEQGDISLQLRPPAGQLLSDTVAIQIAQLPSGSGGTQGAAKTPDIHLQWVYKDDPFWRDNGWNEDSVADVIEEGNGSYVIYVSAENRLLGQRVARAHRHGAQAVEAIRSFYLEHVAFHAFLAYVAPAEQHRDEDSEPSADNAILERERERELQRACQTVLGILDAIFDLVVTERAAATAESV